MKKKLLITGAYGLVGSNICKLLERDYPDIEIAKVKYDETKHWHDIFRGHFDYVVYAAGYGQPIQFSKDKLETIRIHSGLPLHESFSYLKKGGTFLYVSSSEVYSGSPSPHKETDIGTTTPQHPRACYIEGKRCGEAICMAYREQGYDIKIARLALAYGPGIKKGDTRVLNQFIEQALTNKEINLKDEGLANRTYLYAEDAALMMTDILFKGKDVVYNVGGDSSTTIKDLAIMVADTLYDMNFKNVVVKFPVKISSLEGAPDDVKLDITKVMTEFPRKLISLEKGLKRTIEYQKKLYESSQS